MARSMYNLIMFVPGKREVLIGRARRYILPIICCIIIISATQELLVCSTTYWERKRYKKGEYICICSLSLVLLKIQLWYEVGR